MFVLKIVGWESVNGMTKRVINVDDMRVRARHVLPRVIYDFVEGGAEDEVTLRANQTSLASIGFRPRMGVHVAEPSLETRVLGTDVSIPVLLAPVGGLSLVHSDGQAGAARAAAEFGTRAIVATLAGASLEDVMLKGGGVPHWFQLYNLGGRVGAEILIDRARLAGYSALVVNVDTPVVGHKERDIRNGGVQAGGMPMNHIDLKSVFRFAPVAVTHPRWLYRFARTGFALGQPNYADLSERRSALSPEDAVAKWMAEPVCWSDFSWIREHWTGPLVVKGILSDDDARRAVDVGADAVIVSNHGGRQLDGTPATIDALPEVVAAVGGQVDVILDGGVRRGSDVARAIALGAQAVLIGRPYVYGLAVSGQTGVSAVLEILRDELRRTLQLLGCESVDALDRSWIDPRVPPGSRV